MPDTKITALTAIGANPIIPATFPIPMVDLTDTSMAASGTTKKVTVNQILGAGGTATLASATITGDLTVDTSTLKVDSANNRVGIGTASPSYPLHIVMPSVSGRQTLSAIDRTTQNWLRVTNPEYSIIASAGVLLRVFPDSDARQGAGMVASGGSTNGATDLSLFASEGSASSTSFAFYTYSAGGLNHTWNVGAGSTAMTLNSTGLGVGVVPGSAIGNLQVGGSANGNLYTQQGTDTVRMGIRATGRTGILFDSSDATYTNRAWYLDNVGSTGSLIIGRQGLDVVTFSNSGNVGIGVTPSVQIGNYKSLQIGIGGNLIGRTDNAGIELSSNAYRSGSGSYIYLNTDNSASYRQYSGAHEWYTAPSGTAGNTITFTQAMTLDASGNLLVGTTTMPSGVTLSRATIKSTSADWTSVIWNSNAIPYGFRIQHDTDSNGTGNEFLYCLGAANLRASIRSNGGIANYQANDVSLSDSRMKSDIKPLGSYWNKIKSLEIVTFKYKDQTHNDDNIGLIAQQVESVAPEFVDVDGFGNTPADGVPLKTIYTTDLYHAAIKALQEAMTRIEALESKLA